MCSFGFSPTHFTQPVSCLNDIICVDYIVKSVDACVQLLEDSLQMHRLRYVIDGREGDSRDEHVQGMLGEWCLQHNLGRLVCYEDLCCYD